MNKQVRILLAGGGTGGHLMPGIALFHTLRNHPAVDDLHLLHTDRSFDEELLSDVSISHSSLSPPAWPGIRAGLVFFFPKLLASLRRHVQFYQEYRPDVVVCLGGFGCVPAGLSAALQGIPLVLMDQNVFPGLAVRSLHPFSNLFITQWEASRDHLRSGGVRVLGNPIRPALKNRPSVSESRTQLGLPQNRRVLMVLGGSQGAAPLNDWVLNHLKVLEEHRDRIALLHLCGTSHVEKVSAAYESSRLEHRVIGFTEEMDQVYPAADLVLSRAGGTTLAELAFLRKPAVLVPYPHAADDHQHLNARAAASTGGCTVVEQDEFSERAFRESVLQILLDPDRCRRMSERLDALRRPDTAEEISRTIISLGKEG